MGIWNFWTVFQGIVWVHHVENVLEVMWRFIFTAESLCMFIVYYFSVSNNINCRMKIMKRSIMQFSAAPQLLPPS
jgi:hypothetical protein